VTDRYDLVILGGGTAGLVSAFVAAGVGARVALVERDRTGGDCLWTGCVPSKSLIAAARAAHRMRHADAVGLAPVEPAIDFARVMDRVHAVIAEIEPHDSPARLRDAGVEVIVGKGHFVDGSTIQADGRRLRFASAIVATGSEPALPPVSGLTGADVLTTESVWALRELPGRLVVLGGGPIGCELGQAFARLGVSVTLVELADRLLLKEEPDAGALIARRLVADGVDVRLGTRAVEVLRPEGAPGQLVLDVDGERDTVTFDRVLVVAGRRPRTAGIGLKAAHVEIDQRGAVVVDDRLRTSAPRIYAAGDVTARLPFTHVAAHHARVASVNALFGMRRTVDETIPWVTFTDPEVAHVGLTEAQARERWGDRTILARSDYAALDRAITEGEPEGFALLVADPRGRLVGATVAAAGAGEAIAELTARVVAGDKIDALSTTVHAYPTLAEGPSRAADEHLRQKYASPRYRALARPLLAARRRLVRRVRCRQPK
jgi:pyruvate/2-oxoglutarate dehydrogenase complex dihydrolipoamide dehydrogenase (E3) component